MYDYSSSYTKTDVGSHGHTTTITPSGTYTHVVSHTRAPSPPVVRTSSPPSTSAMGVSGASGYRNLNQRLNDIRIRFNVMSSELLDIINEIERRP